ncbi:hypothetical protein CS062_17475 [Roseateles chitinivorans]|uniref:DUF1376 domain-containing protein n=1 Tax=Roseateles chitinivorans TaxID=2917965 RepID=A0A2G9C666_9BURK|nr:DUF1376 domain-containing protein [Roseateles chitinivorans]PIM51916.1 hypothetical protein CS062_17475 [Roseateles chitinivorans]
MSHPAPPYPADTKAKGWRFELDYTQLDQSDTWDLAPAEAKPWLLMMWLAAWKQAPCGSLPADEEVLPAKFGMPAELWQRYRRVMLRGWWEASDGRLYHETLTARVVEMLGRRRSDADRQALRRSKKPATPPPPAPAPSPEPPPAPPPTQPEVPPVSRVTSTGLHRESSTDHGPLVLNTEPGALAPAVPTPRAQAPEAPPPAPPPEPPQEPVVVAPGVAGMLCRRLKAMGIGNVSPGNLRLDTLLKAGAAPEEFVAAVPKALSAKDPFAYLLGIVEGERTRAAEVAKRVHHGPMPPRGASPPPQDTAARNAEAKRLLGIRPGPQETLDA